MGFQRDEMLITLSQWGSQGAWVIQDPSTKGSQLEQPATFNPVGIKCYFLCVKGKSWEVLEKYIETLNIESWVSKMRNNTEHQALLSAEEILYCIKIHQL